MTLDAVKIRDWTLLKDKLEGMTVRSTGSLPKGGLKITNKMVSTTNKPYRNYRDENGDVGKRIRLMARVTTLQCAKKLVVYWSII